MDHVKISEDLRATHYVLVIRTDLEKLEFEGRVEIDLDVNVSAPSITFHSAEPCTLLHAALSSLSLGESAQTTDAFELDKELQQATVRFEHTLKAGEKAQLGLVFKGSLDAGGLQGYYKCEWEHEGRKGVYAVSQMALTEARKVFPCWDEPELKATFEVSMISRSGTVSLSNMDSVSSTPSDGSFPVSPLFAGLSDRSEKGAPEEWTLTKFATTPTMSSYLVVIANGEFEYLESSFMSISGKEINLRAYTTPEYISQVGLALEVKKRVLPLYEKVFDIAYPLLKLDSLVASDFDAGAMENWGLIVFRAALMLYDESKSGLAAKQLTTKVQAHEIAHQWFGNIVTMKWWDNLWLNEAFATLMGELVIIERIHPDWRPNSAFIDQHFNRALLLDSLRSSHPIQVPCPDEKAAAQILDGISYSKGAAVLRMLSYMLGEDVFLKGVSLYLKVHLYGNSVTADLWRGISQASGINVQEIMANWTLKIGYPLLTVTETKDGLHIRQNRYLATNDVTPEEDETLWHVPLNLKTLGPDGQPHFGTRAILTTRETTLPIVNAGHSLYKINADTTGLYRVLYTPEHLSRLGDAARNRSGILSADDRMGLIGDAFTLARSGHGSTAAALDFINKLRNDDDPFVWASISRGVSDLTSTWWEQPKNVQDGLRAFRRFLFAPLAEKLGFDFSPNDSPAVIQLRATVLSEAAMADDTETLSQMRQRFEVLRDKNDGSQIAGDIQQSIYITMVRIGGEPEWEKLYEVYRKSETPKQKLDAMAGLCWSQKPALIQRTLDLIGAGEVKTQDYSSMFGYFAQNPATRRTIWEYLKRNFGAVMGGLKGGFMLRAVVTQAFTQLSSWEDVKDIQQFFEDKDTSMYAQGLAQGLDDVRSRAAWVERDQVQVARWLQSEGYM